MTMLAMKFCRKYYRTKDLVIYAGKNRVTTRNWETPLSIDNPRCGDKWGGPEPGENMKLFDCNDKCRRVKYVQLQQGDEETTSWGDIGQHRVLQAGKFTRHISTMQFYEVRFFGLPGKANHILFIIENIPILIYT